MVCTFYLIASVACTDPSTVANAVGPWVASYNTYTSGEVTARADTPIWILVVAGLLLGLGFWGMYSHLT